MYFPFLYDKQSELLALRALAGHLGTAQKIIPVIEPVNTVDGLVRWHKAFKDSGDVGYVIENPSQQVLADGTALAVWRTASASLFADADVIRPTFRESAGTTIADIDAFVARHPGRKTALIVTTSQLPAVNIANAVRAADCLVFVTAGADRVALVAQLTAARIVEVNDRFPAQAKNADYSGEEWFTRDHLDYASSGYPGFSDYTVLPAKPNKRGGGSVGAVVVHLTYKAADDTIWMQHFLSDEQELNVDTAGSKLLEACAHIAAEVAANPTKFDSSAALGQYLTIASTGALSSLGKNKELEIAHHLFTVGKRLGI